MNAGMGALGLLSMVIGLVCLVLAIMVLIKQFKNAGPVHGIIGIVTCGIWTFIWGWMNASKYDLKKIMIIWTALIVLNVVITLLGGGMTASQLTPPVQP